MVKFTLLSRIIDSSISRAVIMVHWGTDTDCGTAGCILGNDAIEYPGRPFTLYREEYDAEEFELKLKGHKLNTTEDGGFRMIATYLGITVQESYWLFGATHSSKYSKVKAGKIELHNNRRKGLALSRLAKFVAYKRRKKKLLEHYQSDDPHSKRMLPQRYVDIQQVREFEYCCIGS